MAFAMRFKAKETEDDSHGSTTTSRGMALVISVNTVALVFYRRLGHHR
jgi:hypothetical protein